jgi:FAD/FMN-containing dehydrogenase
MTELGIINRSGSTTILNDTDLEGLKTALRGQFVGPGEAAYDEARTIWNAMIDRRPGAVVRCAGAADVVRAVRFARDHDLELSIRAGGHNIAGSAVREGALLIDLTPMKSVRVDPGSKTARVEPGVLLGEFDNEAQAFGLATPLGINSTTGVAGLTLGGGFGWTSRKLGMSVDNLLSVDIVTADGELRRASESENADLFWAVRGGGGNYGIVTSFEFRLHPVGPEVLSGLIFYPQEKAAELLPRYRRVVAEAPDELTCWVVLRKAPPLPFLPEDVHGTDVIIFAACYTGDMAEGEKAVAPLRAMGEPIADVISPHPFTGWQAAFDPLLTPGARNYWKSHDFTELSEGLTDAVLDYAGRLPSPECEIFIGHLGGAVNRVAPDATAYPHRDADFIMNVHTRWQDSKQDSECVQWSRDLFEATKPFATGGVYVNFLTEDEAERLSGAYGANLDRLAAIKAKYDPENRFRANQNIAPRAS